MRLGSDPEVFLQNQGKFMAVCGLLNGHDKWNPMQVPDMPEGFTFQEDNVAVEFGIPPAASAKEFVNHIQSVQKKFLEQHKNLTFSNLSCVVFPDEEMKHPSAHIFGCEPDFNAWNGHMNKKPSPPVPNMRSAGGHVHIETTLNKRHVIQACDLFLGVPSVLMDEGEMRKQLYGKAGCFRPKSYGVEYRTLSNFWIFKKKYIEWVWRNTARALKFVEQLNKQNFTENHHDLTVKDLMLLGNSIRQAINKNDKQMVEQLIFDYDLEVV